MASSKDPSPPLQALITSSLTVAHLAAVRVTALSFLQHINVISASGPLLMLLSAWSTFLFGLHMAPLSAPVGSLLTCHIRETDLWSLVCRSGPISLMRTSYLAYSFKST